jgi:DNA-directed RNA polymerase sigma subunit (sigma70/sigma32)
VEELAKELDTPIEKVEWMLKVSWLPLSLESPINVMMMKNQSWVTLWKIL